MVSVACDYNGNTTAAFDKTVNVNMWHGSSPQDLTKLVATLGTTSASATGSTNSANATSGNIKMTVNRSSKTVRIEIANGKGIAQVSDITITIACENSGDKTLHLYVNGVRPGNPGEKAVVFDLIPSSSSVKRDKSNTLTPSSLTCDVQKSTGSSPSRATSTDGTLYYRKNGDITSASDGTSLTINTGEVSLAATDTYVTFAFFDANGTLRDKERVIIVYDGADGTSPYFADIDNEMVSVACDYNGNTTAAFDKTVNVNMWHGSSPQDLTKLVATLGTTSASATGSTNSANATSGNIKMTVNRSSKTVRIEIANGKGIAQVSDITITIACENSGDKTLHLYVNGVRPGNPGEKAVVFDLIPSSSSVKRDKSNTLTPSSLTCDVQKSTGSSPSRATSTDGTLYYRKNGDITSASDGTSLTINTGEVSLAATDTYVTFAFFDANGTLRDKERVIIVYDGADGRPGNDGLTPNPNMLLRTTFPSFEKIKEKWSGAAIDLFNSSYTNPTPTNELIEGHNIVRMEQNNYTEYDMLQNVGLEANKWYTLSFYLRQGTYSGYTGRLKIFLSYGSGSVGGCISEHWLDGVKQSTSNDGYVLLSGGSWAVTRHVIKFKTVSSMSGVNPGRIYFRFSGGYNVISMPKLEVGEVATPYIANDDDLKGENGEDAPYNVLTYRRYNSRSAYSDGSPAGSSDVSWTSSAPSPTTSYPYIWERIQAYDKNGTLQSTSYVCLTGANGTSIQGKMGRFLWYAGLMSEVGDTTFKANDYQAPYVNIGTEDDPHCYAYVGSNGNSITFPSSASSYTQSNGWEEMDTDFKYLIAKALFSEYAHLGSAIINRDWMISCHGTIGGSAYGGTVDSPDYYNSAAAYTWFDPRHPNGYPTPFSISLSRSSTNRAYSNGWDQMTDNFSLMGNATYVIRIKAKVSNSSYAGHVRIGYGDAATDGVDFLYIQGTTSTTEVELTKTFTQTLPTANDFRIFAATDNANSTITISSITIERTDNRMFIPNYAVDLRTGKSYQNAASFSSIGGNTRVEINDGVIRFFGTGGFANIELGIDTNGCAILNFYDKDGNYKYGLGPDTIIGEMDSVPNYWGSVGSGGLGAFDLSQNWSLARERSLPNVSTANYYKFTEGYTKLNSIKKYNISQNESPSSYNNKCYNSKSMSGTAITAHPIGNYIPSGYYLGKEFMMATDQQIASTEGIYSRRCYSVSLNGSIPVYLGTLYYHKDSAHVNNTWLTDAQGNKLSCSTSKTFLDYIIGELDPVL